VDEPLRIESDTAGVSGTPDIAQTIFDKISSAEIAVFDVTPVTSITKGSTRKLIPNPNVLIELGYAAHSIGWNRIVCVMNTGYGSKPEELPFDLRARRFPICYVHAGDEKPAADVAKAITDALISTTKSCLDSLHKQVERAFRQMNHHCLQLINDLHKQDSFAFKDGALPPAVDRLLDLGLIWCHSVPANATYGYHWSHLGKRVCEEFEKRQKQPVKS